MKTLNEAAIRQAWEQFFHRRDDLSRNILLEHYLPLVKYTAQRLYSRFPKSIELDDLYSAGILGLMDAVGKFDPTRDVRFETYCVWRIEGAILDDIRKTDRVPRLVRARAQQLQRVTQRLEAVFGRLPTDEELADELGMDREAFYAFLRDANANALISLNSGFAEMDGDGEFSELNLLANRKSQDPFFEAQKRDFREFLVKGFSREERLILKLYYFEQMTMREIGMALGISESRVSQMHASILARLQARFNQQTAAHSALCL